MQRLKDASLVASPRERILLQRLLNQYGEEERAETDLATLRAQMGAILARSDKELRLFQMVFDSYVQDYAYEPPKEKPPIPHIPPPPPPPAWLDRYIGWIVAGLTAVMLAVSGIWGEWNACIKITAEARFAPGAVYSQEISYSLFAEEVNQVLEPTSLKGIDSVVWVFNKPGTRIEAKGIRGKQYLPEGNYQGGCLIYNNGGCSQSDNFTLKVRRNRILQANFNPNPQENLQYRFNNTSYLHTAYDSLDHDTIINRSFRWDFGDGNYSTAFSPTHQYAQAGNYTVSLIAMAQMADTTAYDTVSFPLNNLPKPELASIPLMDADLSSLYKGDGHEEIWEQLYWFLIGLLVAYLLVEGIIALFRSVFLDESPGKRKPPLSQPLQLDEPPLDFVHAQSFYEMATQLRKRKAEEGRRRPDMADSIRKTVDAGGFPSLTWEKGSRPAQYLMLIEQQSPHDMLARLFEQMAKELEARDITVAYRFFREDPQVCYKAFNRAGTSIGALLKQFPDYRLIVIGEGEGMLEGSKLAFWTELLKHWQEKVWFSTTPTEAWGRTEQALKKEFLVLPASTQGLYSLVEELQQEEASPLAWWQQQHYELEVPALDIENPIPGLRTYLGEEGLYWMAACARYPELYWELLFQMARMVKMPQSHLQLDYLIHFLRLECFRSGKMSRALRETLLSELPQGLRQTVNQHLLHVLKQERNLPTFEDSYAAVELKVMTGLLEYQVAENKGKARRELRKALKGIKGFQGEDLQDQLSITELQDAKNSVLGIELPAWMFVGEIGLLGLKQRWRVLGILLVMLGLITLTRMGGAGEDSGYDENQIYGIADFDLETPIDTTNYWMHLAYLDSKKGGLGLVESILACIYSPEYIPALVNFNSVAPLTDFGKKINEYTFPHRMILNSARYEKREEMLDSIFNDMALGVGMPFEQQEKALNLFEYQRNDYLKNELGLFPIFLFNNPILEIEMSATWSLLKGNSLGASQTNELEVRLVNMYLDQNRFDIDSIDYWNLAYKQIIDEIGEIDLREIQKSFSLDEVMLVYFWGERYVYRIVVSKKNTSFSRIPQNDEFKREVRQLLEFVKNPYPNAAEEEAYLVAGTNLHRKLIPQDLYRDYDELIIAPHDSLGLIPFGILLENRPVQLEAYDALDYLYSYYSSVRYTLSSGMVKKANKDANSLKPFRYIGIAPAYVDLKFNVEEVSRVDSIFKEIGYQTKALFGQEASKEAFREYAEQGDILHMAMHAQEDFQTGEKSYLLFGDSDTLNLHELDEISIQAKLAILSGCNASKGELQKGGGMISLARAFRFSGCENVVTSLWEVADYEASTMIPDFLVGIEGGYRPADALARAQSIFTSYPENSALSPYYWAQFVVYGENTAIGRTDLKSTNSTLLIILFLISIGAFLYFYFSHLRN